MERTLENFYKKYGNLATKINGEDFFDIPNLKTILHNEIIEGNFKALQFLKWINEEFPNGKFKKGEES
jgi:hypothetical protein